MEASENLFAYGTLRLEEVQIANFGRKLEGVSDALVGYCLTMNGEHRNLEFTGNAEDVIEGMVYKLTPEEMMKADAYEPEGYARVQVRSRSGVDVWVYMQR
jgi:hypothetical protein